MALSMMALRWQASNLSWKNPPLIQPNKTTTDPSQNYHSSPKFLKKSFRSSYSRSSNSSPAFAIFIVQKQHCLEWQKISSSRLTIANIQFWSCLTAAFHTINHSILVERLNKWVGILGSTLNWFSSYLLNRKCHVVIDNFMSSTALCGVLQGSILGPILFSLYMLPLGNLMSQFNCISHHCCADDLQLYFSFKRNDMANINILHDCLTVIKDWMSLNFLQLNPDKTQVFFFGPSKLIPELYPSIGPLAANLKPSSRNLGLIFDHNMHFDSQK